MFLNRGDLGCFDCVGQLSGLWFGRCLGCVFRLSARLARLSGLTRGAGSGAFGALASRCLTAVAARLWPEARTTLLRIFGSVFFLCLGLSLLSTRPCGAGAALLFIGDTDCLVHLSLSFLCFSRLFGEDVREFGDFNFSEGAAEAEDAGSSGVYDPNVYVFELCA